MTTSTVACKRHDANRRTLGWWIAVLFMIGSACFALGALPGFSSVVPASVVGVVFFVGSIFFTSAGYSQFVQSINATPNQPAPGRRPKLVAWQPERIDWWASTVQLVGTLWFNINTFDAMKVGLTAQQQNLRIFTPDFIGSICFLVASGLALREVHQCGECARHEGTEWRIAAINMAGSVFFMASAIAAFVLPSTGDLLDATLANSGTFVGAVCFFWAAALLLRSLRPVPPSTSTSEPN